MQNALSSGAQTVAWDLALLSYFCATLHHTANSAFVTSQDTSVSPASNHSAKADCREPVSLNKSSV